MATQRRPHGTCSYPDCMNFDNGHQSGYCPQHRRIVEQAIDAHERWANDPAADPICPRCGEPTCAGTCRN